MFSVCIGYWGNLPGDGFKLISTHKVSEHSNSDAAWCAAYEYLIQNPSIPAFEILVEKPEWSNGLGGYPTRWDDAPEWFVRDVYKAGLNS